MASGNLNGYNSRSGETGVSSKPTIGDVAKFPELKQKRGMTILHQITVNHRIPYSYTTSTQFPFVSNDEDKVMIEDLRSNKPALIEIRPRPGLSSGYKVLKLTKRARLGRVVEYEMDGCFNVSPEKESLARHSSKSALKRNWVKKGLNTVLLIVSALANAAT